MKDASDAPQDLEATLRKPTVLAIPEMYVLMTVFENKMI